MANEKPSAKPNAEHSHQRKEEQARRSRRRTRQLIGFALTILIVAGAVSIVSSGVNLVKDMLDNTSEFDEYAQRVTPIVWFDLVPFESLDTADPKVITEVAIWGVMNQLGSDIGRDENGQPQVPAIEVDRYIAALFGPDYKVQHSSFRDEGRNLDYQYDPATQMYTAQSTSLQPDYIATVTDIQNEPGGIKRVTVGYVYTRGSNNELVATPDLEHPAKYMDFLFRREGGQYYLYALQTNTSIPVASGQGPASSQPTSLPAESVPLPVAAPSSVPAESTPVDSGAEGGAASSAADAA